MHQAVERISPNAAWADMPIRSIKGIAVLLPLCGVILALWLKPGMVNFREFPIEDVVRLLTGLIVIALFIERAVEVLLTPWRGTESQKMTTRIKHEKAMLEQGKADPVLEVSDAESQLLEYKGETRKIAFLTALAFGMTISALGVRGLQFLIEPQAFSNLLPRQIAVFNGLDVLLTGALLAGGADGLHKIVLVFTSYMDKSVEKAKTST